MNAATESGEAPAAPALAATTPRPFYWSVRRELWENRSLYVAPLVVAGVVFLGFLLNAIHLPQGAQILATLDPARQRAAVSGIYGVMGMLIVLTMAVVAWFYSLDALYGERRDRSIMFWKSMPVSDTTTVVTKLFTAMVVAPAIAFVIIVATQVLILLLSTIVVLASGANPAPIWTGLELVQLTVALLYMLVVLSLWYSPIYAWLLLVSAWAKRSTFLWAVLPPIAIVVFEKLAFGTGHFSQLLAYRLKYGLGSAFADRVAHGSALIGPGMDPDVEMHIAISGGILQHLTPVGFLCNPWLWAGLAVAAVFTAAAVWVRRHGEPM